MDDKQIILQTDDIHKVTEYISQALQKPVIIENKNFELISYSSSVEEFDQTQQKTILSKKCPVFIIDRLKKEGIVQKLEKQLAPIRVSAMEDLGFYERVVIGARYLQHTMGYIWVQESSEPLKDQELHLLEEIASHVGKLIYDAYNKWSASEGRKDELLWKLIHHEYGTEQQMKHDAALMKLPLPARFSVLVFSLTDPAQGHLLDELYSMINPLPERPRIQMLKAEFQLVLIVHGIGNDKGSSTFLGRLLINKVKDQFSYTEFYAFMIGLGKEYNRLFHVRKSFLEALEVIETANFIEPRPESMPREFSKLGVYRYLATLYEKNSSEDYFSEDLLILISKDAIGHTDLLKTLEVYLANNGKGKQTATELFIHPNTLNYRIKQIVDLTNIDFSDFNMKSYLYTELLLLNNVPAYYKRYKDAIQSNIE
ncbi:PucR family transcriptional regulator [Pontibacillus salicampi]|uniref:PucR family transcriptional regulator n=1 Tax=Pontibacillus salicampi TaxID=1449801 RepID=A0ABV6LLJ9_9BACI